MTSRLTALSAYLAELRTELRRLGAYRPDAPADAYPRAARAFMEIPISAGAAAAWMAAGIGPSAARPLLAEDITPAQWCAYADRLQAEATKLNTEAIALEWLLAGRPIDDAVAWANRGYLPAEAAPLIGQGVTPLMADAVEDAGAVVAGGPDAHLRAAVLDLAAHTPALVVDPDLADRLGLDEPGPSR